VPLARLKKKLCGNTQGRLCCLNQKGISMKNIYEMYEMLIRHRLELHDAIVAGTPEITLQVLVQAQRNQWGSLLKRIEQDKKS
jgi:hypothetical protein